MNKSDYRKKELDYEAYKVRLRAETEATLITETPEETKNRITHLLLPRNYGTFWNYYLGASAGGGLGDKPCAPFHTLTYRRLAHQDSIVQFRIWFRNAAKSLQTNVGNALALKFSGEMKFMALIGINEQRAKMLLADLQAQLEANARILRDFGPQIKAGDWRDGGFETIDGCYFIALGINQPFRGLRRGANRIDFAVVDDCEDPQVARNPRIVGGRCDKITKDLFPAFSQTRRRLVVCNNLFVKGGLLETLQERFMHASETHTSSVAIENEGEPTWKDAWSKKEIEKLKKSVDHFTWSSEYMNLPIERGKVFKAEWIQWAPFSTEAKPAGAVVFWDLSYKTEGDYKACAVVGAHDGCLILLDVFCRRCDQVEAMAWHYEHLAVWRAKGWPVLCYYDATAAQESVFAPIWRDAMARHGAAELPQPDRSANTDKHLRIQATLTSYLHNGQLRFSQRLKNTPDMDAGLTQLFAFEKGSTAHDDFPDALEAAVRLCAYHFSLNTAALWQTPIIGKREDRSFR